jgi:aryl-alcohol dehydrogenase-like predicted oxidoreductase
MTTSMTVSRPCFGDQPIPRLGMGCWAIGGPSRWEDATTRYGDVDDNQSLAAIAAAIDAGVKLFDTAAVYGAGHSERLLGQALREHPDVSVSTKIGYRFDEDTKQVLGDDPDPTHVLSAIDASLARLQRERIDLLFLHINSLEIERALAIFDVMDDAIAAGKVGAYGWSTDFPDRIDAVADRANFVSVQHGANVLFSAPAVFPLVEKYDLVSLNRSPLAMGALTGKYSGPDATIPSGDLRSQNMDWMDWFKDARVAPQVAATLDAVRDLLCTDGRTLAQGSLAWLWAKSPNAVPLPGFRTVAQVEENTGALAFGPLPDDVMAEIETLVDRSGEHDLRER